MLRDDLYRPWFDPDSDKWGIEILSGEFKSVVIKINSIEFNETAEGNCQLDYETLAIPESLTEESLKTELFSSVINIIITDVLEEAIRIHSDDQST
jgi:hypothetical protein